MVGKENKVASVLKTENEVETDPVEEFVNELDLESLVSPTPSPDAIQKGLELERYLEMVRNEMLDPE